MMYIYIYTYWCLLRYIVKFYSQYKVQKFSPRKGGLTRKGLRKAKERSLITSVVRSWCVYQRTVLRLCKDRSTWREDGGNGWHRSHARGYYESLNIVRALGKVIDDGRGRL